MLGILLFREIHNESADCVFNNISKRLLHKTTVSRSLSHLCTVDNEEEVFNSLFSVLFRNSAPSESPFG